MFARIVLVILLASSAACAAVPTRVAQPQLEPTWPQPVLKNIEFGIGEQPSRYLLNVGGVDIQVTGVIWLMLGNGQIVPSFVEGYVLNNGQLTPTMIRTGYTGTTVANLYLPPATAVIGSVTRVNSVKLGTDDVGHLVFTQVTGFNPQGQQTTEYAVPLSTFTTPCTGYNQNMCVAVSCGAGCGTPPNCGCLDGRGSCASLGQTWCSGDCPPNYFCNGANAACKCELVAGGGTCPTCPPSDNSNDGTIKKKAKLDTGEPSPSDDAPWPNQQPH